MKGGGGEAPKLDAGATAGARIWVKVGPGEGSFAADVGTEGI
jgi:hypothetical protein